MVPLWSWLGAGCHPNRRTLETMKAAGLEIAEVQYEKLSPVIPVVIGIAHPNGKQ